MHSAILISLIIHTSLFILVLFFYNSCLPFLMFYMHTFINIFVYMFVFFFFFQAEDGIRDYKVTGVQTCALPIFVADPRKTELAARADLHLQMQPGTDVALFNAMLGHILARGLEGKQFVADRTRDFGKLRDSVRAMTPEVAAKITGVPAEKIKRAAEIYARGPNTSTLWAMGLTQHANGTDLVTSLLNLMLACGMIGRWGAAMMPVRGQNNVQGASDVGAIPFVYTDYRPVKDPKNRAEYAATWGVPAESLSLKEGLMVTEIVKEESGVRGMYIMGENPVISDPDVAHAEHWFQELEFLVARRDLPAARRGGTAVPGADRRLRRDLVPVRRPVPDSGRQRHFRPRRVRAARGAAQRSISVRDEHGAPAVSLAHGHDDAARLGARPA